MNTYTTTSSIDAGEPMYVSRSCCCSIPYEQCCGAKVTSVPFISTDRTDYNSFGYDNPVITWPPVKEGRIKRAVKAFIAAWKE